ncbi:hypothetical protein QYF61_022679 [Mycteria americana]|uniref:Uncharacterized protein n=1 Tax=Mycteria americana TaxID=33587 RepID=A0AAN7P7T2_MYCAM|nr:hypothetical protein QYF61_022679 [Mycteria americana]
MIQQEHYDTQQGQMQSPAPGNEEPFAMIQAGDRLAGGSSAEKNLGVLVDSKLNMSRQHALAAKKDNALTGTLAAGWKAPFQPLFPKSVALHGVVVTQVQDPALSLVESHTIGLGQLIQPVQIPLQSLPTLKEINASAQLGVICKLTEGALNPLVQIIDKDIKQNWSQY